MNSFTRAAAKLLTFSAILLSAAPVAAAVADSPAVLGANSASVVAIASTAGTPSDTGFQAVRGRPNYIAGYTQHALDRMAERRISRDQVESVIASHNNGVWQPEHRTWKVCWGGTCVAINDAAEIVTVF
jgi:hypothetical protein